MNYTEVVNVATQILIIAGIVSMVVSLLMEFFIKKLFKLNTKTINGIIVALSESLTILASVIYMQVNNIVPVWYVIVGILFLGILVSIIAMNGYDKIFSYVYEYIRKIFNQEN